MTYDGATYCRDCDLVHGDTRKQEPWRWRCLAHPTEPGFGFVDPDYSPTPPYALCRYINDGQCPYFEKRREPEKTE